MLLTEAELLERVSTVYRYRILRTAEVSPQSQQSCRLGRSGQSPRSRGRERELKHDRSDLEDRRI